MPALCWQHVALEIKHSLLANQRKYKHREESMLRRSKAKICGMKTNGICSISGRKYRSNADEKRKAQRGAACCKNIMREKRKYPRHRIKANCALRRASRIACADISALIICNRRKKISKNIACRQRRKKSAASASIKNNVEIGKRSYRHQYQATAKISKWRKERRRSIS